MHKITRKWMLLLWGIGVSIGMLTGQSLSGLTLRDQVPSPSQLVLKNKPIGTEGIAHYGSETQTLFKEGFSKLTMGAEGSPDRSVRIYSDESEGDQPISKFPVWFNLYPKFSESPEDKIWGAGNVYPAGGMLYMAAKDAKINTPLFDVEAQQGNVFVRFRARAERALKEGEKGMLVVEAAETFNVGATWRFGNPIRLDLTTEWQEYTLLFQDLGKTSLVNIVKMAQEEDYGVYIDDIEIFTMTPHVAMPVVKKYVEYKGSSVRLRWNAVEGADGYLLNAYHLVPTGELPPYPGAPAPTKPEMVLTNLKIPGGTTTSYTWENITSGEIYYYWLTATKGDKQSIPSLESEIWDLEAPVAQPIEGEAVNGIFMLNWSEVPSAERYNVFAYVDRIADQDGEFVITNEDFSKVLDKDGNPPTFTPESPDPYAESWPFYVPETKQGGWVGYKYMGYKGCACIDGWAYYYNPSEQASLQCEEIDLSKNDGKFTVTVDLYGELAEIKNQNAEVIDRIQVQAAIALFTYDEELGDFKQSELIYPEGIKPGWQTFTIQFTKGTPRSKIGIFAVRGPGRLYIDNLKITQHYKKGETFRDPYYYARFVEETSHQVLPRHYGMTTLGQIAARVVAVRAKGGATKFDSAQFKESAYSNTVTTQNTLGVEQGVAEPDSRAYAVDGVLYIQNPQGATVKLYNLSGECLRGYTSGQAQIIERDLPAGGYMVVIGGDAYKVVL